MAIEGETIRLREEREEDIPLLIHLRNDLDTQAWSKTLPPDYTQDMYQKRYTDRDFTYDRDDGRFIIEFIENQEAIGYVGFSSLTYRMEVTVGIMIDKKYWGSGVALETQELLIRFLFEEMGVRVIRLWTQSGNPRAMGLAEKSGFKVSLRRREAIFKDGKLYDNIGMDILREEYYDLHPELKDNLPGDYTGD